jgi:hypothetical protein
MTPGTIEDKEWEAIKREEERHVRVGQSGAQAARAGLAIEHAAQEALRRARRSAHRVRGLTPQERDERALEDAYCVALSPAFAFSPAAAEWNELAILVLQQKSSPLAKAEKIAHIVDLWHHASLA